ncbi:ATP-dependent helicase HrpB [Streptomyces sp. BI20]|uniref:ATP-dependent helicase HrpB n=1 Tax=Streptomyces sp. BI20 TaxID=3403460 RepID=UPI003C746D5C
MSTPPSPASPSPSPASRVRARELAALPVGSALPGLRAALVEGAGAAVLCAPPGTGKTTLVPLALAGLLPAGSGFGGGPARRVLVAEPRRIAARAAARRMAWLLGERVGESVGFTVRGERVVGPDCRVEVVTTGVLLRRLQRDQELSGVDLVVLDECHERHLDADTVAAFLCDVRAALRPELGLIAASATTDAAGWAGLLGAGPGRPAPVVEAAGTAHEVAVVWAPPPVAVRPPRGTRVDPVFLAHVASVVRRALAERPGDVLCFLPGVGEIARVAGALGEVRDTSGAVVEVLRVHGRAPAEVQDAVLSGAGAGRRRVVLATAVAESSLTVPGVRVVVDAGLAREPRMDHARGMGSLVTVRASRASGRQRAGRAGREAPGAVYRCWAEAEERTLPAFPTPEIRLADLTSFALQVACWGDPDASGLALADAPPAGALAAGRAVLSAVGAVDDAGRVTARGARMARSGLHPRAARALLDGASVVGARRAAEVVALLSEEPPREYGEDLAEVWRVVRRGGEGYPRRWREEARRLARAVGSAAGPADGGSGLSDEAAAGLVVALAFPERVARAKGGADGTGAGWLTVSGTGVTASEGSRLRGARWLAVAVADRGGDAASARVRSGAAVSEADARSAAAHLASAGTEVVWRDGDVVAREVERLGAVELTVRPVRDPDPALVREALLAGLRAEGPGLLRWSERAVSLRARLGFLARARGGAWPAVDDASLVARAGEWLEPELSRARRRADLGRIDAGAALERLLPWASGEATRLDVWAPERIEVPSGSRVRVDYSGEQPVLAVKLQELFGWTATPRVGGEPGVPVVVHLLSPAGRPAAVTADLESFWREGYRAVRAELRGRYPRHPWPEDPGSATATRYTKARSGG